MTKFHLSAKVMTLFGFMLSSALFSACSDDGPDFPKPTPTENPADMITDKDKLAMIYSLSDLEGDKGRIYEMTYTVDYKLDDALNYEIDGLDRLNSFVANYLLDKDSDKGIDLSYGAGCSAFACPDSKSGNFLMGRNFDFGHFEPGTKDRIMIPVIAVHTAPAGGKKSVSFVDGQFVGYRSGFYTDHDSDLSTLMALPYLLLDGINEDGFAISVLLLDGMPTKQQKSGKKKIFTTVAMRMLLDRASTVKEAVNLLDDYNMCMRLESDSTSYHFLMADATGDFAIVEYTEPDIKKNPSEMEVLTGNDAFRYVTNFYVSPSMADTPNGSHISTHGKNRYNNLEKYLQEHNFSISSTQALEALKIVAQGPEGPEGMTGFTQWSEVYNLNKKTLTMNILREWDKQFTFSVEQ